MERVEMCLVANNNVWSYMAGDAPQRTSSLYWKAYTFRTISKVESTTAWS